jgi:peptidoglycan/LPS O-acetylase OafA/YrhL
MGSFWSVQTIMNSEQSPASARVRSLPEFYKPELDILRFGAFLLVFIHHTFPSPEGSGPGAHLLRTIKGSASLGVPLFFLLSAYLITELMLRERTRTGTVNIGDFYIRRVLRIWPLYFASFAAAIVFGALVPSQHVPVSGLFAAMLLVWNWWICAHGFPASILVAPLWSISVEEQFYLIWPTLVKGASQFRIAVTAIIVWLSTQAYIIYLTSGHTVRAGRLWTDSVVHFQYFGLGILICVLLRKREIRLSISARLFLAALAVPLLCAGQYYFEFLGTNHIVTPFAAMSVYLPAGFGACCIFFSCLGMPVPPGRISRCLIYLGKISYGLYVFHESVIHLTIWIAGKFHVTHGLLILAWLVALPMTICVAMISYKYFELPFLKYKERFSVIRSRLAV